MARRIHLIPVESDSQSQSSTVHECPKCGAVLEEQHGFGPDLAAWQCRACGQWLYGNTYEGERFPGTLWFCDECGTLLNQQQGFSDTAESWPCQECGHIETFSEIRENCAKPDRKKHGQMAKRVAIGVGIAGVIVGAMLLLSIHKRHNCL